MTDPLPHSLPYGIRDIKFRQYTDATCTALQSEIVDLPVSRTLSFKETEDFNQLEGDDEIVATHGAGPQVEWELESGGISLKAWSVMTGATYDATTARRVLKKSTSQSRPYFYIEGQVISDSGGDIHCEIFRAKMNDDLEGEFAYGEFMVTSCSGVGYGSLMEKLTGDEATEILIGDLYRFVQNGEATTISASLVAAPANLSITDITTTTVSLEWDAVTGADTYQIYQRVVGTTPWVQSTTSPASITTNTGQVTGLTLDTEYEFVVRATDNLVQSGNSNVAEATTAAA